MLNNIFTTSPLVWGSLLAGLALLPPLIHLINMMRHKRVKWAAMEFLLHSHKKHRNWVWLKQLLLLLSRISALLLALFLLGQVGCENDRVAKLLGGKATHHYVLLDDSFSMSDRGTGESAFDRALSTLSMVAARGKDRQNQRFSVLRFSKARYNLPKNESDPENVSATVADMNAETIDSRFGERLEAFKAGLNVSSLAVEPLDGINVVKALIESRPDENAIVYLLSDFREKDWGTPDEIEKLLSEITSQGAVVELISCSETENHNLAIAELVPDGNVRVAGTPLMMKLTVKNCGSSVAKNIQVKIEAKEYEQAGVDVRPQDLKVSSEGLPTVFISEIAAGKTETRKFPVFFNSTGEHAIVATLPDDAINADNVFWNVTNFQTSSKVLLVDEQDQLHSSSIQLALNPGGMTGLEPQFRTKDFLRDTTPQELAEFDVIFLLDIPVLDETAVKNLGQFVEQGGGVCFFLGPRTSLNFYNSQLYANGQGLLPMPLDRIVDVPEQLEDPVPDIVPADHPVFAPVLGVKNSFLDYVQVGKVIQPPREWVLENSRVDDGISTNSEIKVAATIRGDQSWPLVVEGRFGSGRMMVVTTTAGQTWNNWMRNPTFPPTLLLIQNYLAQGRYRETELTVGSTIQHELSVEQYTPNLSYVVPGFDEMERLITDVVLVPNDDKQIVSEISMETGDDALSSGTPGIYEIWIQKVGSAREVRRTELNVDVRESETGLVSKSQLLAQLEKAKPTFAMWNEFNPEPEQKAATSLTKALLFGLFAFFVIEQLLAYWASFHPSKKRASGETGRPSSVARRRSSQTT